ncbi:cryptochrome/photolyase family protein [Pseudoteredinibacter isoporae]|uniref:Deoxyribodipyrimidine photolyase-related protein n=1 Tax=Pseudoteredinibacter isoporae TaxID=570281 RepID=A0A7X0MWN0_9GAMM|nr:cryptochrome/photolyase family protein [Pseudoteredinibacter isoporae]MBB6520007.1 deoxyribodipyrimidine photolyase-related protein [Pseudoteredinibacter isoporae]NHO85579.1 cryptochrome/photolyase family protein [Pseudoteredinibacter isoporae]NIB25969.1 cryptochrome/photolyase family protein [Pseudoteredinibacter isoporae]
MTKTVELRFLFGDQLNIQHSWFADVNTACLYVMAEMPSELAYVRHHHQKISAFFAAMRAFSADLKAAGHRVLYLDLNQCDGKNTLVEVLHPIIEQYQPESLLFQEVDEFRLQQHIERIQAKAKLNVGIVESEHYFLPKQELSKYFSPGKHKKMEFFYRALRKRFDILMCDGGPEGERWNFDSDNRKKLAKKDIPDIPEPLVFENDVNDIADLLETHKVKTIGAAKSKIDWPVNREQSLRLLHWFCQYCLPNFGRFQDAMTGQSEHSWSLYHSRLSFSLNCKLLSPDEVIKVAIQQYRDREEIDLAQLEGFVRQILGWREFVRGIYWTNMPGYKQSNFLASDRKLPDFFWNANVDMHCLRSALQHALERSYSHHIERLMVIGNYCLLAGIDPDQVDEWYLGVYADAIEWVQLPNTRGMSQFADGGLLATKPYVASGAYMNRMSDHCRSCTFNVKKAAGEGACPLNSLYWYFLETHRERFAKNPRMTMSYKNWDAKSSENQSDILETAQQYLSSLQ